MNYEHFFGMHVFWWLFWLFLFISFFFFDFSPAKKKKENPFHILKKRFANGEITEEEYREKKSVLEEDIKKPETTLKG